MVGVQGKNRNKLRACQLQLIRKLEREREREIEKMKFKQVSVLFCVIIFSTTSSIIILTDFFFFPANTNNDVLPNFVHNQQKCVEWPVKKVNYRES